MQTIQQINIPEPCHQKWNDMTPNNNGRFCGSCAKTVIDFTAMSNEQIIAYLSASNSKTCGRFNDMQISALNHRLYADNLPSGSWWKRVVLAVTMLSAVQYLKAQSMPVKPSTEQEPSSFMLGKIVKSDTLTYRKITGIVTDVDDKLPLPGVTIKAPGLTIGTQTGADGKFTLNVPSSVTQLMVAFVGYDEQYVAVNQNTGTNLTVSLKARTAMLGEVIIIRPPFLKRVYYRFVKRPVRKIFG